VGGPVSSYSFDTMYADPVLITKLHLGTTLRKEKC